MKLKNDWKGFREFEGEERLIEYLKSLTTFPLPQTEV